MVFSAYEWVYSGFDMGLSDKYIHHRNLLRRGQQEIGLYLAIFNISMVFYEIFSKNSLVIFLNYKYVIVETSDATYVTFFLSEMLHMLIKLLLLNN